MTYRDPGQLQQPGTPGAPYLPGFPGVPEGPLGDLQNQVASVLNAADSHHAYLPGPDGSMLTYPRDRQPSILRDTAFGAMAGFAGALAWRHMGARKQRVGQFTTPVFRSQLLWWALFAIVVYVQAVTGSWAVLIGGFIAASVASTAYLIYSSRKARRSDHRRS